MALQTEKLYYQDPHLREFTATILEKSALADGQFAIILDRTAFYPEGGGQPCDTGRLNEAPVLSVQTRNGDIIHTVACDPGEGPVTGRIDWQRRFDHMQQHTGEQETIAGENHLGRHVGRRDAKHRVTVLDRRIRTRPQQATKRSEQKNDFAVGEKRMGVQMPDLKIRNGAIILCSTPQSIVSMT